MAYFWFTTVHAAADAIIFEESGLLVVMLFCRLVMLVLLKAWISNPSKSRLDDIARRVGFVLPLAGAAWYWIGKMPFCWESDLWSVQVDCMITVWILAYGMESSASIPSDTLQEMFACYYTAAGFWKINSHFLDPKASCATVFMSQHIAAFTSNILTRSQQVSLAKNLSPYAPIVTIGVELSMGLPLVLGRLSQSRPKNRFWTRLGLFIILQFHLAVCVTPEPNNISLFALQCATRLVMILDPVALQQTALTMQPHWLVLSTLVVVVTIYGIQQTFTPLNWAFAIYIPVMVFLSLAVALEHFNASKETMAVPLEGQEGKAPPKRQRRRPVWTYMATGAALFYSFGTITLGFMEEASNNMFANLKIHGGSNHMILPTGLLFRWFRDAGDAHPYGGGEIRIESTTSNWLQTIYPNDLTHVLGPTDLAADLLEEGVGAQKPNFFNAGANRVLGLRERGWVRPPPDGRFIKYSVPSLEWKRLLSEAIVKDDNFKVVYSHLPGSGGDELWRAGAFERKVWLVVKGGLIRSCRVQNGYHRQKTRCHDTELPYNLKAPWWSHKVGLYHGYPILYNSDGTPRESIQCFGP